MQQKIYKIAHKTFMFADADEITKRKCALKLLCKVMEIALRRAFVIVKMKVIETVEGSKSY